MKALKAIRDFILLVFIITCIVVLCVFVAKTHGMSKRAQKASLPSYTTPVQQV